jgi:hypothetical protein
MTGSSGTAVDEDLVYSILLFVDSDAEYPVALICKDIYKIACRKRQLRKESRWCTPIAAMVHSLAQILFLAKVPCALRPLPSSVDSVVAAYADCALLKQYMAVFPAASITHLFIGAACGGNIAVIKYLFQTTGRLCPEVMVVAARHDNVDLLVACLEHGLAWTLECARHAGGRQSIRVLTTLHSLGYSIESALPLLCQRNGRMFAELSIISGKRFEYVCYEILLAHQDPEPILALLTRGNHTEDDACNFCIAALRKDSVWGARTLRSMGVVFPSEISAYSLAPRVWDFFQSED